MENKVKQSSKNKEENLLNEDRKAFNKRLKRYASRISYHQDIQKRAWKKKESTSALVKGYQDVAKLSTLWRIT